MEQITYVIKSGKYYKIGFTQNEETFKLRMTHYDTHNPDWILLTRIEGNYEKFLHFKFKGKNHRLEWFLLEPEDLKYLLFTEVSSDPEFQQWMENSWKKELGEKSYNNQGPEYNRINHPWKSSKYKFKSKRNK